MNMDGLLGWPQVLALVPLSKRDLQRRVAAGIFPQPRKLGRRALFVASEIRAFIEKLKNQTKP
jgi:predicted DNA-binding transcriptional regulator AlpA